MYQKIGEDIGVLGIYQKAKFILKKFEWRGRDYLIEKITLISDIKDGQVRKRLYSVACGPNLYRLEFNRESEKWTLEEVWCE